MQLVSRKAAVYRGKPVARPQPSAVRCDCDSPRLYSQTDTPTQKNFGHLNEKAMIAMDDPIQDFSDERLKGWCVHCGSHLDATSSNLDHAPSKSFLLEPYPVNLPMIRVCTDCNSGHSLDEEYLSTFLACVISGTTDPDRQTNSRVARTLRHSPKLRARIDASRTETDDAGGTRELIWNPEWERVIRVVIKNARGHAFYEFGEPMLEEPVSVAVQPLVRLTNEERMTFESAVGYGWPEVGSRMMTRLLTGQDMDGAWVVVQKGAYRYMVEQTGGLFVRTVLSEYLATEVIWD